MPKAIEIAQELRKVITALEANPQAELPYLFACWTCYSKESFLAAAKIMPKPFEKQYEDDESGDLRLKYESTPFHFWITVSRNLVCKILEPARPAVYDCVPVLSMEEEESLERA